MRALAFNSLDENCLEPRIIEIDFVIGDDFYIKTNVSYLLMGEVWKDTEVNRDIIERIITEKKNLRDYKTKMTARVYKLVHGKEK